MVKGVLTVRNYNHMQVIIYFPEMKTSVNAMIARRFNI